MKRYLIVANETLGGPNLLGLISERLLQHGPASFFVVVPATPPGGLYDEVVAAYEGQLPDHDADVRAARARLDQLLAWLRNAGADAGGAIGDGDPLVAIEAIMAEREFDEVIVSTLPPGASRWLALDLVHRVRRVVDVPVTHVDGPATPRPGQPVPPPAPPPEP